MIIGCHSSVVVVATNIVECAKDVIALLLHVVYPTAVLSIGVITLFSLFVMTV